MLRVTLARSILKPLSRNNAPQVIFRISTHFQQDRFNSDFGSIYHPFDHPSDNESLNNSVRCCLSGHNAEDFDNYVRDTGMSICFLGTSAGQPTRHRSPSATLLRLGGSSFLFDAGEGVQRQLAFTRAKPTRVERIFITHLHGDHIFGLPGFLLGLQNSIMAMNNDPQAKRNRKKNQQEDHVVKIYGPPGLYNFIASNITLSCTKFHSISIEVFELVGGRVRRIHGGQGIRNPFLDSYPEFNFGFLKRKKIECKNGVWNINDFPELTRQDVLSNNTMRGRKKGVRIKAAELDHLPGIATFGFVVEEEEPARNIDAERAKQLGVSPVGKKYELLKFGFSALTDDGSREVRPEEVLKPTTKAARKIVIVGDNRAWTKQMVDISKNADVIIHEATLTEEDSNRGHSTASMAGRISGDVDAKVLILNHISSKFSNKKTKDSFLRQLIHDAKESSGGKSDVLVSYDFMEILVPWMGFREEAKEETIEGVDNEEVEDNESEAFRDTMASAAVKRWFGN